MNELGDIVEVDECHEVMAYVYSKKEPFQLRNGQINSSGCNESK